MAFANVLKIVGASGKFQVLHVCFLSLFLLDIPCHFVGHVFLAATPQHRCRIPWLENASLEARQDSPWNLSKENLLRIAIPWEQDSLSRCSRYVRPQWQLLLNDSADVPDDVETEGCVDGWEYDTSEFSSTIVTEWDLVCRNRPLKQMTQSVFMGGVLVGALIFGGLADKYGRRNMILICDFLAAITGICTSFAPNIALFSITRFLTGLFLNGSYINGYALGLEWLDTSHRVLFNKCMAYSYTSGQFILVGLAYAFHRWRHLYFVISFPLLVIFCLAWFHPESARWLIHQGRYDDALKCLRRVAKINGKSLPEDFHKEALLLKLGKENEEVQIKTFTFIDLFRTRRLMKNTLIMMFLWFQLLWISPEPAGLRPEHLLLDDRLWRHRFSIQVPDPACYQSFWPESRWSCINVACWDHLHRFRLPACRCGCCTYHNGSDWKGSLIFILHDYLLVGGRDFPNGFATKCLWNIIYDGSCWCHDISSCHPLERVLPSTSTTHIWVCGPECRVGGHITAGDT
uniref:steroid transmembrane transporter SLC22A24-like isoform X4 n=1 Tax=Myxine glutinosa TaxID=7769 RepID=UPI00358F6C19